MALFSFNGHSGKQGSLRIYSQAAEDVVQVCKARRRRVGDEDAQAAWVQFTQLLSGRAALNAKNNPMASQGFAAKLSVIELGRHAVEVHGCSIIAHIRSELKEGRTSSVHKWLKTVNGVGDKIASFLLRDVELAYQLHAAVDRHLLQPIDVWVQRCTSLCLGERGNVARAIVEASALEGVSDTRVNAGMWYFGARVAQTEYRLHQALEDRGRFWRMIDEHVTILKSSAGAFSDPVPR